ncbi:MAG: GNAT family N-acetyltransferase [Candidatus Heteroscillospira sp.]|jgi:ribosomal-protein-alanine N-acetyltransferase
MYCNIRKWTLSDAEVLAEVLSNTKIHDNLRDGLPCPYTKSDAVEYISSMLSADESKIFAFAITLDERVIGSICAFRQDNVHRQTAELGYYIAQEYWGQGITVEAVTQICEHIFTQSDIIRIYAEPFARNAPSCRVLEKAGFKCEGTLRHSAVKNGKTEDTKIYALLKTD